MGRRSIFPRWVGKKRIGSCRFWNFIHMHSVQCKILCRYYSASSNMSRDRQDCQIIHRGTKSAWSIFCAQRRPWISHRRFAFFYRRPFEARRSSVFKPKCFSPLRHTSVFPRNRVVCILQFPFWLIGLATFQSLIENGYITILRFPDVWQSAASNRWPRFKIACRSVGQIYLYICTCIYIYIISRAYILYMSVSNSIPVVGVYNDTGIDDALVFNIGVFFLFSPLFFNFSIP